MENPILKMTEKPNIECINSGFAGTPGYLAPEVIKKNPYGKRVDLWACGEPRCSLRYTSAYYYVRYVHF